MSSASAVATEAPPGGLHELNRPNLVSVGTIVWLSSELMFFAGLFAMYFNVRAANGEPWPPEGVELNLPLATLFTAILVLSSVTCQFGVFAAERGDVYKLRLWFVITFVMGLIFELGQVLEYVTLIGEDVTLSSMAWGSVFYLTTGFHWMHVAGGLVAFILLLIRTTMGRFTPAQATSAVVVSYYWHFVDVVWVALFTMIYIIQ